MVFVLWYNMFYFYVLGTHSTFQALKHWHKCVSNPMWKPQGRNSRMVRSVLDLLPANLSLSMCKNRPKASYSRSFPWGFKNTVLSYLHSHPTFPCLWSLNFDNTYSSLRYTHYCHDGRVQAVPHLCSFPGMAGIIKDLGRQWKVKQSELKEDIKDLLKAPKDQGNLKKSPEKKYIKPCF